MNREHLVALLLGLSAAVLETTCWRLPAPQGPFLSCKTNACPPREAVAPYKDDGTGIYALRIWG